LFVDLNLEVPRQRRDRKAQKLQRCTQQRQTFAEQHTPSPQIRVTQDGASRHRKPMKRHQIQIEQLSHELGRHRGCDCQTCDRVVEPIEF
jgi:hypothetical protein